MSENTSSSLPIKLLWQGALIVGLILGIWVLGRTLPLGEWFPALAQAVPASTTAPTEGVVPGAGPSGGPSVKLFALPQSGDVSSALKAIAEEISKAKSEIYVTTRGMTSSALWTALSERAHNGLVVYTLLTPESTLNFAQSKLANWLNKNTVTNVYRDTTPSASNLIVIDGHLVIISDVPFSQKSFEGTTNSVESTGFAYMIDSPELGAGLVECIKAHVNPANKLL
jgi:hypothetical protein